ncbi:MAG: 50S ribosomal protein L18 [Spirochaetales bacterium]|nr:50S ribosomal protein L18 [Spirochaetales bacterium]
MSNSDNRVLRLKRKVRIRKNLAGTAQRPRLSVFKSNKYFYAQVIDDRSGNTLASISNLAKDNKAIASNVEGASKLGELFGQKLVAEGIKTVVFDRNGYRYHGVVKSFADSVRKTGVEF